MYKDKKIRPPKVMVKGLHPMCRKDDIIEDLKEKVFEDARDCKYIERSENFDNSEIPNKIHNLRAILNMKVKIEVLRKVSDLISQCRRCPDYNQT